jgi:hypothetical protein
MRGRAALLVIAAVLAGGGLAVALPDKPLSAVQPNACGPAHSRTLAQSSVARVYSLRGAVYGCSARTGRRTKLGSTAIGALSKVGLVRLAGACAAYEVDLHGIDSGSAAVVVRRLSDGAKLGTAPAVGRAYVESFQTVTSLVVRRGGAIAWIARDASIISSDVAVEVHKLDRRSSPVLLDRGKAIDPSSLRLSGSSLTWTDGGATRSSTLP